eukprot:tig00000842_g4882.t1
MKPPAGGAGKIRRPARKIITETLEDLVGDVDEDDAGLTITFLVEAGEDGEAPRLVPAGPAPGPAVQYRSYDDEAREPARPARPRPPPGRRARPAPAASPRGARAGALGAGAGAGGERRLAALELPLLAAARRPAAPLRPAGPRRPPEEAAEGRARWAALHREGGAGPSMHARLAAVGASDLPYPSPYVRAPFGRAAGPSPGPAAYEPWRAEVQTRARPPSASLRGGSLPRPAGAEALGAGPGPAYNTRGPARLLSSHRRAPAASISASRTPRIHQYTSPSPGPCHYDPVTPRGPPRGARIPTAPIPTHPLHFPWAPDTFPGPAKYYPQPEAATGSGWRTARGQPAFSPRPPCTLFPPDEATMEAGLGRSPGPQAYAPREWARSSTPRAPAASFGATPRRGGAGPGEDSPGPAYRPRLEAYKPASAAHSWGAPPASPTLQRLLRGTSPRARSAAPAPRKALQ